MKFMKVKLPKLDHIPSFIAQALLRDKAPNSQGHNCTRYKYLTRYIRYKVKEMIRKQDSFTDGRISDGWGMTCT